MFQLVVILEMTFYIVMLSVMFKRNVIYVIFTRARAHTHTHTHTHMTLFTNYVHVYILCYESKICKQTKFNLAILPRLSLHMYSKMIILIV